MSSDIKLTDDEGITLLCEHLLPMNSANPAAAVRLGGQVRVTGIVRITPWTLHDVKWKSSKPSGPESSLGPMDVSAFLGSDARVLREGVFQNATDDLSKFSGDKPKSSPTEKDVFDLLRAQDGEVDLAREIGLLRLAILDLHDRLTKK